MNKLQSNFKKDIDTPWSKFITGNALAAVLLGLIILVAAAIPVSHMRLGIPDDGVKPADSTQKKLTILSRINLVKDLMAKYRC